MTQVQKDQISMAQVVCAKFSHPSVTELVIQQKLYSKNIHFDMDKVQDIEMVVNLVKSENERIEKKYSKNLVGM